MQCVLDCTHPKIPQQLRPAPNRPLRVKSAFGNQLPISSLSYCVTDSACPCCDFVSCELDTTHPKIPRKQWSTPNPPLRGKSAFCHSVPSQAQCSHRRTTSHVSCSCFEQDELDFSHPDVPQHLSRLPHSGSSWRLFSKSWLQAYPAWHTRACS